MTHAGKRVGDKLAPVLLDHVAKLDFADLPGEAVKYCKLLVMDSLGVTLPGMQAPGCSAVTDLVRAWAGSEGATVLLHGFKAPPPLAALANSTMMHALDFDDTFDLSALHTFVSVLPAALATAEAVGGVDGKKLITALVLGVEVINRISLGIRRPLSWIRSSTCGSFGAAACAGKILGLSRAQMTNALGVVYAQTAGNAQSILEGRLVKRMQPGFAAQAGVTSAFLARAGITGSHDFLEGAYGFYNLYERGEYDPAPVLEGLGQRFSIMDLSLKPYPCCRMTHSAIDAALELRGQVKGQHEQIEALEVKASSMVTEMVGRPFVLGTDPQVDAQFSIPYTVSAALIRGDVFLRDFELPAIQDETVKNLADKVKVKVNPSLPAKDLMHAALTVIMQDGRRFGSRVDTPLGNPAKPLDLKLSREKFNKCLAQSRLVVPRAQVAELLAMIEHLEDVGETSRLARLLQANA